MSATIESPRLIEDAKSRARIVARASAASRTSSGSSGGSIAPASFRGTWSGYRRAYWPRPASLEL